MEKIILVLLGIFLLTASEAQSQFTYTTNADNTIMIIGYSGSEGELTIPSNINGMAVTGIGPHAFSGNTTISNVTIPDGVTSIGESAFGGDDWTPISSLSCITIPNSVTSIGDAAFANCRNLGNVAIPGGVTNFGVSVFESCFNLTNVVLANGLPYIGADAFEYCMLLDDVTIPSSVTNIETQAFLFCLELKKVTFYGLPNIGLSAFQQCTSLSVLYFAGDAPTVDFDAFYDDGNLTFYYLPGTTGWANFSTNTGFNVAPWYPQMMTGDGNLGVRSNLFGFNISWANGQTIVVEGCTNLVNPTWLPLQTNTLTNGKFYFTDPQCTQLPGRYYRVIVP